MSEHARLCHPVQSPGSTLNRNWRGAFSLLSFDESNMRLYCLSQKSAQKYQHEENCGAANAR
jgi:hypothetical protein